MSRIMVVWCVLGLAGLTFGAVEIGKPEPIPEKYKDQKGCYLSELEMVIPVGSTQSSKKECLEYWCGKEWVTIATCGVVSLGETDDDGLMELVEDLEKPYPECCPHFVNSTAND